MKFIMLLSLLLLGSCAGKEQERAAPLGTANTAPVSRSTPGTDPAAASSSERNEMIQYDGTEPRPPQREAGKEKTGTKKN